MERSIYGNDRIFKKEDEMISYKRPEEIDREKWDRCIANSVSNLIYPCSWYLDIVSPGWCGLIEGDYDSVMPLPVRKKYGIHYIIQPYFTQQLGIFSRPNPEPDRINGYLNTIPSFYRFIDLRLNFTNFVPGLPYKTSLNSNYELLLSEGVEKLRSAFSLNTSRNIRKSLENITITENIPAADHLRLIRNNPGVSEGFNKWQWLMDFTLKIVRLGTGTIWGALDRGMLCASVLLLNHAGRIYYLVPGSTRKGRENMAMFAIIDRIIEKHAGQNLILDFEGSNIEGIARFYEGFGALKVLYPGITINRLPFPVKYFV
jgi:hypothetical protein